MAAALADPATPAPTLAVVNARVWTGNPAQPSAAAIAVAGERIIAVGSDKEIRRLTAPSTRVVDARGAMLAPGFIDSHIHLLSFETSKPFPPLFLRFVHGKAGVAERIAARTAALQEGGWIVGHGWTDATWGGQLPSLAWLDKLAPRHPLWLTNEPEDVGIANSAALRAAGITAGADDPTRGIVKDTRGQPTGIIRGGSMWRIEAALMERTREQYEKVLESGMEQLLRAGVTSVHHNNSWHQIILLRRLRAAGKLRVRVYASPSLPSWRRLRDWIAAYGRGDSWLHWGAVKGYGTITEEQYYPWVSGASAAGLQVMVHVGDKRGLHALLSVFERVRREQNLRDPRFRVEHAHDMPSDAIPRMARAGGIASWQPPLLLHDDQRTKAGAPPPENLFPCRALLNAGVRIAFGTDTMPWPGASAPLEAMQIALERAAPDGSRLTLDEALRAFTRDAAFAEFAEDDKGTLEPGKLADFVLLDRDLSRVPVNRIKEAQVRMTVVGGRVEYDRRADSPAATQPADR